MPAPMRPTIASTLLASSLSAALFWPMAACAASALNEGARPPVLASELVPAPVPVPVPAGHFQQLLQAALARDPQVQGATALLQASQSQLRQIRSRWFPTLGLSANKTQSQDEDLGQPIERNSARLDASLKWNLYAGGADMALYESIKQEVKAAALDLKRAREECAEKMAMAHADAVRAETVVRTATELMQRLQALKALVDKQVASGKSSDVDAQTSASSLLEVSITLTEAQADARRARLKLSALSGQPPGDLQALALPPSPVLDEQHPANWLDLREGNSRYGAARLRAAAARLKVGKLAALVQPRIDLQLRHALSEHTTPTPTSNTRVSTSLGMSVEMPLGGESFAKRDEGLQRAQAAEADADRISLDAQIDWADAADRLATARYTLGIHQKQLEHLERVLRGAAVQFEAGRRSLIQLIDLQKMPFATRQKMAENASVQFTAQLRMLALSGGLLDALNRAHVLTTSPMN